MTKRSSEQHAADVEQMGAPLSEPTTGHEAARLVGQTVLDLDAQLEPLHAAVGLRIGVFERLGARARASGFEVDASTAELLHHVREKLRSAAAKLRHVHSIFDDLAHSPEIARARARPRCHAKPGAGDGGSNVGA